MQRLTWFATSQLIRRLIGLPIRRGNSDRCRGERTSQDGIGQNPGDWGCRPARRFARGHAPSLTGPLIGVATERSKCGGPLLGVVNGINRASLALCDGYKESHPPAMNAHQQKSRLRL
jgi:hypothetical protein